MIATVATVVFTHNLAIGVFVGCLAIGFVLAGRISQVFNVRSGLSKDGKERHYVIEGTMFYATVNDFTESFDFKEAWKK